MANNTRSDATPIPTSRKPEFSEEPSSTSDKKENKTKQNISDESSSSDSNSDDASKRPKRKPIFGGRVAANIINIDQAKDVHIGNRYTYSNTVKYSKNHYSESDYCATGTPYKDGKGPKPSDELLNSKREIDEEDKYIVAEDISIQWKKLARLLPPKNVFSDGQLKTFEANNPNNLEEVVFEMLNTWKQKHPENATVGILATTLWNIGKGNISQKLKP